MQNIELVIDDRERAIFPHLKTEAYNIKYTISRIEIGDYAIIDNLRNKIIAVFERKTLEDLASSLKDGRYENKTKMLNLRAKTGCAVFFILEGPTSPAPNTFFGGIPYAKLESAVFHMMVRDNISVIHTLHTLDTMNKLIRFYHSMISLVSKQELQMENAVIEPQSSQNIRQFEPDIVCSENNLNIKLVESVNQPAESVNQPTGLNDIVNPNNTTIESTKQSHNSGGGQAKEIAVTPKDMLVQKEKKSHKDVLRELWSVFKGITVNSADIFLTRWTIADIIFKNVDLTKLPKGIKFSRKVLSSLSTIDKRTEERLLATIPGISADTSKQILTGRSLRQLLTYEIGAISIIKVGKAQKNLGEAKATKIKQYLFMKFNSANNRCEQSQVRVPTAENMTEMEKREDALAKLLRGL